MSIHDHNTRSKKHLPFEDAMEKMESNIRADFKFES